MVSLDTWQELPVRKRQKDTPPGAGVFQKTGGPPSIVNVVKTTVRSSAAVLRRIVGCREVEMILDFASSIPLIQESVTTSLLAVKQLTSNEFQIVWEAHPCGGSCSTSSTSRRITCGAPYDCGPIIDYSGNPGYRLKSAEAWPSSALYEVAS